MVLDIKMVQAAAMATPIPSLWTDILGKLGMNVHARGQEIRPEINDV